MAKNEDIDFEEALSLAWNDPMGFKEKYSSCEEIFTLRGLFNETLFHYLCVENQLESARILLEMGFDVNPINEFGDSPLHNCVEAGQCELVKCLLDSGANPNIQNSSGETPLFVAYEKLANGGHKNYLLRMEEIKDLLLLNGANPHVTDHYGRKPGECDN